MLKKTLITILLIAALAFAALYFVGQTRQKELAFYGNIDTRTVDLAFRFLGTVDEIYKDEGERVSAGDLLARLDSRKLILAISQQQAQLEGENATLSKMKKGYRSEQIQEARGELSSALAQLEQSNDTYARQSSLIAKNATSREAYLGAKYQYDAALGAYQKAKASYDMYSRGYEAEDIRAQDALVRSLAAQLDSSRQDLIDSEMRAPFDGVILARLKEPGSIAAAGEVVFEMTRQDEFWVKAYVDEANLGLITQGARMAVQSDVRAEPYDGVIGYISPVAQFTPKTIETAELRSDLVYQFRVLIKDPDTRLKQGLPVTLTLK